MVFTQEIEVAPEPELGPGWRKMETKVDNRVVKTKTRYWNPKGEELTYKEVKKIIEGVKKRKSGPRLSAELESPPKKTHLALKEDDKKKKRTTMVTKEKAEAILANEKGSKKVRKCEKHQVVFKSENEEEAHMEEFHKKKTTLDLGVRNNEVQSHAVQKVEKKKKRESLNDNIPAVAKSPPVMQQDEVQAKYSHLVVTVVPPGPPPGPHLPSSSSIAAKRLPPPGPPSTTRPPPPLSPAELAVIRCDQCEYSAKSKKRLKKHMEAHTMPDVKARAVLEDLGNLSIDGVFESFNGEDMNSSDELNTARVVEVEDEFEVEEVRTVFSGRPSGEHNSYNGSEDEGEVEVDRRSPEEITLASETEEEPEEITLDEGDEGELENPKKSVIDKAKQEEEELAKMEEMDGLLAKSEFVEQMMESKSMLAR